uniref:RmlD-like substrate binding domain-containing protein n=1 Tax=Aureoumbra lagunensis TaxID=44058 RepID=A0A7S3JY87_9STRA|mmetsp:Transcript_21170/g.27407  ORF Transcript_21170/g.27407 Transcript_21170/m.27407 type:complete len:379 (+) Transcript_21170:27-1163(+)|eukprot:CAMPEP_0197315156 /NCGR_PEP_ID=MMETSP0891-20130614/36983_1 /TAXON_ID=44058 ORGANISM="Aureoumbra lagunensis, Strain CCMP1510" /NCGR_SAMPLE_ID=MMETSP0891 /ASSEMBLY_ACC=CAM_ASM_000534 /LENGTH=378 /DNA_ID=CAMNT_0042803969 /DNA_START=28 /DNA_END=1164 /DNA_ORIENTATION=+
MRGGGNWNRCIRRNIGNFFGEYGHGGHSSNSGLTVAMFGATHTGDSAMLCRYLSSELGKDGSRLRAANHGCELELRHLKTQFDLGQYYAPFYSPRDAESMATAIGPASVVVNCIGNYYETGSAIPTRRPPDYSWRSLSTVNYSFEEVHIDVARRLAEVARVKGVETFIHVSSSLADPNSPSRWARSRYQGELAVREAFPEAIIIRPTPMFGHEDRLLNWVAQSAGYFRGYIPLVEDGAALAQPVFVQDVAKAVKFLCRDSEDFIGKTFHLAGPADYSRRELAEFVLDITKQNASLYDTPSFLAHSVASLIEYLPMPHWTIDDVQLAQVDALIPTDAECTFSDLDINPTPVEKIAFSYLHRFRTGGHFILAKGYHKEAA